MSGNNLVWPGGHCQIDRKLDRTYASAKRDKGESTTVQKMLALSVRVRSATDRRLPDRAVSALAVSKWSICAFYQRDQSETGHLQHRVNLCTSAEKRDPCIGKQSKAGAQARPPTILSATMRMDFGLLLLSGVAAAR